MLVHLLEDKPQRLFLREQKALSLLQVKQRERFCLQEHKL